MLYFIIRLGNPLASSRIVDYCCVYIAMSPLSKRADRQINSYQVRKSYWNSIIITILYSNFTTIYGNNPVALLLTTYFFVNVKSAELFSGHQHVHSTLPKFPNLRNRFSKRLHSHLLHEYSDGDFVNC